MIDVGNGDGELQYIVLSRAYYGAGELLKMKRDNIVDEVMFGRGLATPSEGETWGASFSWHYLGSDMEPGCRLSVFDDAWVGLFRDVNVDEILGLAVGLDRKHSVSIGRITAALESMGFRDVTPVTRPAEVES